MASGFALTARFTSTRRRWTAISASLPSSTLLRNDRGECMKSRGWLNCRKQVEDWRWGCGRHWDLLPDNIQQKIRLKRQGAEADAREWILRTFGADDRPEYNPGKWIALCRMVRDRDEARARRRDPACR